MTAPRQTISYLTRRFAAVGLKPSSRHGQNFLIDYNLLELLARAANISPDDVILEVGTGTGALTAIMAQQAAAVVTVEIDQHLFQLARETLEPFDNVRMLNQDALKNKNRIHDNVLSAVRQELELQSGRRFKLAANLPYNIATPLMSNLLAGDLVPDTMTVTVQKELAERIMATPSTKDYSALSVWMQSLCDIQLVRVLAPSVFWPQPKVESAIIHLRHEPEKRRAIDDLPFFHQFVRALFFHRRKFLRSVLISAFKDRLDKSQIDRVLADLQWGSDTRAEQLTVDSIKQLSHRIRQALPTSGG